MAEIHEGGCLCRTVRYQVEGAPNDGVVGHVTSPNTACAGRRQTGMVRSYAKVLGGLISLSRVKRNQRRNSFRSLRKGRFI